ncbi:MAG: hypothetical protein CMJ89_20850 [Planctomycetes bacterium]|nr:hypothetical protein [Planctomycetota bacterium]
MVTLSEQSFHYNAVNRWFRENAAKCERVITCNIFLGRTCNIPVDPLLLATIRRGRPSTKVKLTHAGRIAYEHLCEELLDDPLDISNLIPEHILPTARVTRLCTPDEKKQPEAAKCRSEEMQKICTRFRAFDRLCPFDQLVEHCKTNNTTVTLSRAHIITSKKFVEFEEARHKWKGRFVVDGDRIFRLPSNTRVHNPCSGISSTIGSLETARFIIFHALLYDHPLESIDVTSAYLQAEWPADFEEHWILLTADVIDALPDQLRQAAKQLDRPCLRLRVAVYGHPASGHIWGNHLARTLADIGWQQRQPTGAIYVRDAGKAALSTYVDDLISSADRATQDLTWSGLEGHYECDTTGAATDLFIGLTIRRCTYYQFRWAIIDMSAYAILIVSTYEKYWNVTDIPLAWSPLSEDPRDCTEPPAPHPVHNLKHIQGIIHMILWLCRCGRTDIAAACSLIASTICAWTPCSARGLLRIVGYIKATKDLNLTSRVHVDDTPDDLHVVCYTDSDWHAPRSLSGEVTAIVSARGTFGPLLHAGTRQPICADNVGGAENIAAHRGTRNALPWLDLLTETISPHCDRLLLRADNATVERTIVRGDTTALQTFSRAIKFRCCTLRDLHQHQQLLFRHIPGPSNPANILTKVIAPVDIARERLLVGVFPDITDPAAEQLLLETLQTPSYPMPRTDDPNGHPATDFNRIAPTRTDAGNPTPTTPPIVRQPISRFTTTPRAPGSGPILRCLFSALLLPISRGHTLSTHPLHAHHLAGGADITTPHQQPDIHPYHTTLEGEAAPLYLQPFEGEIPNRIPETESQSRISESQYTFELPTQLCPGARRIDLRRSNPFAFRSSNPESQSAVQTPNTTCDQRAEAYQSRHPKTPTGTPLSSAPCVGGQILSLALTAMSTPGDLTIPVAAADPTAAAAPAPQSPSNTPPIIPDDHPSAAANAVAAVAGDGPAAAPQAQDRCYGRTGDTGPDDTNPTNPTEPATLQEYLDSAITPRRGDVSPASITLDSELDLPDVTADTQANLTIQSTSPTPLAAPKPANSTRLLTPGPERWSIRQPAKNTGDLKRPTIFTNQPNAQVRLFLNNLDGITPNEARNVLLNHVVRQHRALAPFIHDIHVVANNGLKGPTCAHVYITGQGDAPDVLRALFIHTTNINVPTQRTPRWTLKFEHAARLPDIPRGTFVASYPRFRPTEDAPPLAFAPGRPDTVCPAPSDLGPRVGDDCLQPFVLLLPRTEPFAWPLAERAIKFPSVKPISTDIKAHAKGTTKGSTKGTTMPSSSREHRSTPRRSRSRSNRGRRSTARDSSDTGFNHRTPVEHIPDTAIRPYYCDLRRRYDYQAEKLITLEGKADFYKHRINHLESLRPDNPRSCHQSQELSDTRNRLTKAEVRLSTLATEKDALTKQCSLHTNKIQTQAASIDKHATAASNYRTRAHTAETRVHSLEATANTLRNRAREAEIEAADHAHIARQLRIRFGLEPANPNTTPTTVHPPASPLREPHGKPSRHARSRTPKRSGRRVTKHDGISSDHSVTSPVRKVAQSIHRGREPGRSSKDTSPRKSKRSSSPATEHISRRRSRTPKHAFKRVADAERFEASPPSDILDTRRSSPSSDSSSTNSKSASPSPPPRKHAKGRSDRKHR